MLRKAHFTLADPSACKAKIIKLFSEESHCCILDSNETDRIDPYKKYDFLAAAKPLSNFEIPAGKADAGQIQAFLRYASDKPWLFGGFSYELKNSIENLHSNNTDYFQGPDMVFFEPDQVFVIRGHELTVYSYNENPVYIFENLQKIDADNLPAPNCKWTKKMEALSTKNAYLQSVQQAQTHIVEGDIYEINFCQTFLGEGRINRPISLYSALNAASPSPFSSYLAWGEHFLLCASPERFIAKRASALIAQPIKGTRKRGENSAEDDELAADLRASAKDQAENIMIVDLMRHDLSRSCQPGSVQVPELFGIYRFKRVIQMISTVIGELRPGQNPMEALLLAFPMGSMTGAPKIRSMQIIEDLENFRRSWFSGSFGYVDPDGDFDFNVIIRSILYNATTEKIMLPVGGAIVYDSDPEEEFEETLLKARPALQVLHALENA